MSTPNRSILLPQRQPREEAPQLPDHPDNDQSTATEDGSADHWNDDGGSWWDPHPVAPSFRPAR